MAFVYDQGDPSGLGMYSKAGRFTSEKYIIFQRKDDILNDQKKFKKVSSFPSLTKVLFNLFPPCNTIPLMQLERS